MNKNFNKKVLRRLFKLLLLVIAANMTYHYFEERSYRANMPMGEVIGLDENAVMANAIAMALNMINNTRDQMEREGIEGYASYAGDSDVALKKDSDEKVPVVYRRDVHIKSHGCVKATITVPELENKYRWGVFKEAKTWNAWIRFSNGDYAIHPDGARDARGMAVKLMKVDGEKLLQGQQAAKTQDFVMMNSPNYFIRHLEDYVELTKYLAVGDNFGYFLNGYSPNLFSWRWRELRLVGGTKKGPPTTPLTEQYFSASSYKLGADNNIKFSARPKHCELAGEDVPEKNYDVDDDEYNFLRLRMDKQLQEGPACFDFMVQLQVPGKIMPVEDATIVWREKDSPFVPIAHIEIPQQTFSTPEQNEFCEDLSFNPWHSLPEHRPTGVFNRVRKALYEEVAKYRWDANRRQYGDEDAPALHDLQPPEPANWCIDGSTDKDCPPAL